MKLKLTLLSFCLFGIGIFSHAQEEKSKPGKTDPAKMSKKLNVKKYDKDGSEITPPPPPPKIERVRFKAPKIVKDNGVVEVAPPPPPKMDRKHSKSAIQSDKGVIEMPPPPPPKIERIRFKAPEKLKNKQYDKDGNIIAPPPPSIESPKSNRSINPNEIPKADQRA